MWSVQCVSARKFISNSTPQHCPKFLQQILIKDSPELLGLLDEFKVKVKTLHFVLISVPCLFNWLLLAGYRQTPSISAGFLPPKIWIAISMVWFFFFLMSITWCFKAYHNSVSHVDTLSILYFQWELKKLPATLSINCFHKFAKGQFFPSINSKWF